MNNGIIYIMTTAISGLIKIGKTQTRQFSDRMRYLESNGYYNVVGLKQVFAIEVDDYGSKEKLLHEVFARHRVADSELFALDVELVEQLLLAFDGRVIFPENVDKERRFGAVEKARTESSLFSFYRRDIKNGDVITFRYNRTIKAKVIGEREVEYLGYKYKFFPLTRRIMEESDRGNKSGAYQGSRYWDFNGKRLLDIKNIEQE